MTLPRLVSTFTHLSAKLLVARVLSGKLFSFRGLRGSSPPPEKTMDDIPDVDIDSEGKFKYILIKVADASGGKSKHIVRGYTWAPFHADILERVEPHILKSKLTCECVGGGRIEHSPAKKTIRIYGYSQGYGQADHKISCELVKKEYPEYTVTWSNEGY